MIIPYLIVASIAILFVAAIYHFANADKMVQESLHIPETCKENGDFFTDEQIELIKRAWYCEGYDDRKNGVEPQFYVEDLQFKENANYQEAKDKIMEQDYILSEIRQEYDATYGKPIPYDEFKRICFKFYELSRDVFFWKGEQYAIEQRKQELLNSETATFTRQDFDRAMDAAKARERQDIVNLIESRLAELIGDAQPTPILRAELNELLNKIKNGL